MGLVGGLHTRKGFVLLLLSGLLLLLPFLRLWATQPESEAPKGCGSSVLFPRRTVCFLKTHKCASSAVQNLLMRYGDSHDLRFVLPSWSNYLGFTELFNRSMAAGHPPFDMLAHHARFNESEMRAVLGPDPVFITIVREPATLFESLYSYYDFERVTRLNLEQLERARRNQSLSGLLKNLTRKQTKLNLGFNQMSFDLGLEPDQFGNESTVRGFVQRMDATFDLVMVAERMNESLVLLRDLLCWSLDDVVLFRLNARQKRYRHTLSPELAEDFRALNSADVQLYEHFKRRFDQRVREFGQERMARELFLLEERTRFWHRRCVKEVSALQTSEPEYKLYYWISNKVLMYHPKNESTEECTRLMLPEVVYTERLRKKQNRTKVV
ncbi:galactosylceramide sulfotransferase-like [Haemaphysalis longicornis]